MSKVERTLTTDLLRMGYAQGFFPMPDDDGQVYWYKPDPRAVFPLDGYHVSRSLRRSLRRHPWRISFDTCFRDVMEACADRDETWINDEFLEVYGELHAEGDAHSVEVWLEGKLVGGAYGVHLRGGFFAESMFYRATDASKVALFHLIERLREKGFALLEVQFMTPHLRSLGAAEVAADDYVLMLEQALDKRCRF